MKIEKSNFLSTSPFDMSKYKEVSKAMNYEEYSVKDTNQTFRTINHWEQEGLLATDREKDSNWRKFSFVELIRIRFISELREFGVSIEKVKSLIQIFEADKEKYNTEYPLLEKIILHSTFKESLYLVFNLSGSFEILPLKEVSRQIGLRYSKAIVISINFLISRCEEIERIHPKFLRKIQILNTENISITEHQVYILLSLKLFDELHVIHSNLHPIKANIDDDREVANMIFKFFEDKGKDDTEEKILLIKNKEVLMEVT